MDVIEEKVRILSSGQTGSEQDELRKGNKDTFFIIYLCRSDSYSVIPV